MSFFKFDVWLESAKLKFITSWTMVQMVHANCLGNYLTIILTRSWGKLEDILTAHEVEG